MVPIGNSKSIQKTNKLILYSDFGTLYNTNKVRTSGECQNEYGCRYFTEIGLGVC